MEQLSDIVVAQHPIQPKPESASSGIPITLLHTLQSDSDQPITHSQTQPYLRREPASKVLGNKVEDFLNHVVPHHGTAYHAVSLDLSDLKYNPSQPRQAEELLAGKLNACIKDTSPSKWISGLPYPIFGWFPSFLTHTKTLSSLGRNTSHQVAFVTVEWT